jgi:hypothetical protein
MSSRIVTYAFRRAIAVPAIVKAPDRAAAPGGGTRTTQLARYRRRRRRGPQTLVGHRSPQEKARAADLGRA